jgi:hypothetical protein
MMLWLVAPDVDALYEWARRIRREAQATQDQARAVRSRLAHEHKRMTEVADAIRERTSNEHRNER